MGTARRLAGHVREGIVNRLGETEPRQLEDARKRAVIEMTDRYESALRRTARRYSLDSGDAEDAYQRAMEIVLTKAPTTDPHELVRWTQTVTKHEALAVRRSRERLLGPRRPEWMEGRSDPLTLLPSSTESPDEQVERREDVARSREALRTLKPPELRALSLLAEGYSYAEIGRLTGYSQTKVNRVLAEGRSRFRDLISRSEDGRRCRELRSLLSAFCDGEASDVDAETVREHLRACASCRATMRAYRAAPGLAGALVPALLPTRSLLGRFRDLLTKAASQVSGTAKLIAACGAGTAGCVAVGVLPTPFVHRAPVATPAIVRPLAAPGEKVAIKPKQTRRTPPKHKTSPPSPEPTTEYAPEPVEYEAAEPAAEPESSGDSAAGEFGP